QPVHQTGRDRIARTGNNNGYATGRILCGQSRRIAKGDNDVDVSGLQLANETIQSPRLSVRRALLEDKILTLDETLCCKRRYEILTPLVCCANYHAIGEQPNAIDFFSGLLRAHPKRPCHHATKKRYELTPLHSITSSARASNEAGTVRPSDLAVFKLTINSYFVGACTGRSAGFSPLRMRST